MEKEGDCRFASDIAVGISLVRSALYVRCETINFFPSSSVSSVPPWLIRSFVDAESIDCR